MTEKFLRLKPLLTLTLAHDISIQLLSFLLNQSEWIIRNERTPALRPRLKSAKPVDMIQNGRLREKDKIDHKTRRTDESPKSCERNEGRFKFTTKVVLSFFTKTKLSTVVHKIKQLTALQIRSMRRVIYERGGSIGGGGDEEGTPPSSRSR